MYKHSLLFCVIIQIFKNSLGLCNFLAVKMIIYIRDVQNLGFGQAFSKEDNWILFCVDTDYHFLNVWF